MFWRNQSATESSAEPSPRLARTRSAKRDRGNQTPRKKPHTHDPHYVSPRAEFHFVQNSYGLIRPSLCDADRHPTKDSTDKPALLVPSRVAVPDFPTPRLWWWFQAL